MLRRLFALLSATALACCAALAASGPALAADAGTRFEGPDWGWGWPFVIVLGVLVLLIGTGLWWWFKRSRRKQDPI